ncbi:NAD(+) hydrolase SARM1 [Hyla sarda]|uniref:NAD(+) hydrolase SARM1 n=1 Tax=Hyla sarda TaxID=327740 RepID=UPI0024C465C9|nr:NAD(+) hydrolase SARM1 [Hyla sarda]XP_056414706.1 NAD(+) hydrolase SARM1 [Hyla sarda]XP_056414707.1 NAD(+) hydrolase SARM1 [Hyla sarda]XP_056414708.1 NAD(+) hydrolase SARM1 [Hyla sarda]
MVLTLLISAYKLCRYINMFNSEHLVVPGYVNNICWWQTSGGTTKAKQVSPGVSTDVQMALDRVLPDLHVAISKLKQAMCEESICDTISEIFQMVEEAWVMPAVGREVAQGLCETIRLEGALDLLLSFLQSTEKEVKYKACDLLEQILVSENRDRIARVGLGVILNISKERDDPRLARHLSGILEHMFKHSEETCRQLICDGGLDSILFWCRWTDPVVLRHCAMALANCAMYGGPSNQRLMTERKTAEWLFPLVFSKEDDQIRFHACLAITVLATNKEIEKEVERSGTLALVEPFISTLDPEEYARCLLNNTDSPQGRTAGDLQRLVPLLDSSRLEAQCIAAFYLCVEAAIKSQHKNTKVFNEIGATQSLKRIVCYSADCTVSSLAKKALRMIGEEVPSRIARSVPNWKPLEVQHWLQQIGFNKYSQTFIDHQMDGDLLLRLNETDLREDLGMTSSITRKRFLRELVELKTFANYSTCDRSNLADWLGSVEPRLRQYTYNLVICGIDRNFLHHVTEQQLEEDCHITTGFHRVRILSAAREMLHSPLPCSIGKSSYDGPDVFISYRRSTGSQLASLLKVHLYLHGFTAFIDVEKLEAGKFEDKLIQSVISARNFVLVLSAGALDKCMGDNECKDWVHKEIVTALNCGKNIVPVTDHFEWPDPISLPEDMRAVLKFNGIKWSHEYQDATVEKIIRFLQGRSSRDSSVGSENSLDGSPPLGEK